MSKAKTADQLFKKIVPVVKKAKTFVLTTHVNPDGDGLGSEIGMATFLKSLKKKVRIINTSPTPRQFGYLNAQNEIETYDAAKHDKIIAEADIIFILDISVSKRLDRMQEAVMKSAAIRICIDHHLDNDECAKYLCIDAGAPATAELIFMFIKYMKGKLNYKIAQALYTSLLTDTGGFRFNSTRPSTHAIAGEFLKLGVKPNDIYSEAFEKGSPAVLKLLGRLLERIKSECGGGFNWAYLTTKDFSDTDTLRSDTDGFVDYTLKLDNSMMGVLAYQTEDGIKFSLRSKGDVNVQAFAKTYGGGGHKNASGLTFKNVPFDETLKKIIGELADYYNKSYAKKK